MAEGEATGDECSDSVSDDTLAYVSSRLRTECSLDSQRWVKNPMTIARRYQIELCKRALEKNIIVYMETGSGKTLVAVLVMYELRQMVNVPQQRVCIFLAPTVALVHQQAKVIREHVDFIVGIHCGMKKHLKSHNDWETEIKQHEVLVMTPQTLLYYLSHGFIKMDFIVLLVLDECHHAQMNSCHPYAEIMRVFRENPKGKIPRIFGMTASPIMGKGDSGEGTVSTSINSLEKLLGATIYTVDKQQLEDFLASPEVIVYLYNPCNNDDISASQNVSCILEVIKHKCLLKIQKNQDNLQDLPKLTTGKKLLEKVHGNIMFCVDQLGIWGASQACHLLLSDKEWSEQVESEGNNFHEPICNEYLKAAEITFDNVASHQFENLTEPFFSTKILCLIKLLSTSRFSPDTKCIIFVNRITIARCLSHILQQLKSLAFWKCEFLVGIHSGLRGTSRRSMKDILENFRNGKVNLLVATKVCEEGLDIQTCCLVIRFDLPDTLASFIQSRGRARMRASKYVFLVNSANKKELNLIKRFKQNEDQMNVEIYDRTSEKIFDFPVNRVYKISQSGASVTSGYSCSLLHHYCSKLMHDEFFDPKPNFYYFDYMGKIVCRIVLPSSAPFHEIDSAPQGSTEAAKRDACLNAIERLHKLGALNNYLLPCTNEEHNALMNGEPSANMLAQINYTEAASRGLYEMVVPSVMKHAYNLERPTSLHCYYLDLYPTPNDRTYKSFGLLLLTPLPQTLEGTEIELHLDRGRSVTVKLVPHGLSVFNSDEIMLLKNFQEMYLRLVLDRSEFTSEYVKLGKDTPSSNSSFYLLPPVNCRDSPDESFVDWDTVTKSLSSSMFEHPESVTDKEILSTSRLYLANGSISLNDIQNSLVYVPYVETFYFIISIVPGKNAYSPYKALSLENHVEHLSSAFGIHLNYPSQSLLLAKQLFRVRNLLCKRESTAKDFHEKGEHLIELVPELCELKIKAFSKEIGSTVSLLPSIMHRLESLLVAHELKCLLSTSFPEGSQVTTETLLEALTTEMCQESFSLERLEVLGDAFLKFVVSRSLFLANTVLDPGSLTDLRSNIIDNENLCKVAIKRNLQVYIRDQSLDPTQFFAVGRPCLNVCTPEKFHDIHFLNLSSRERQSNSTVARCSKGHHLLANKTIANVLEAIVGTFLVDSGFKAAIAFLKWVGINVDYDASEVINIFQASSEYMILASSINSAELEKSLGYTFEYKGLLLQAFIHPSYNRHGGGCYERLEYLGDAVLDYVITSYIFSAYRELKPGHLTELRSSLVNNRVFANLAIDKSFHRFIICDSESLSKAIQKYVAFVNRIRSSEGEPYEEPKFPKALSDLMESSMGAIYLDSGTNLRKLWDIVLLLWDPMLNFSKINVNPVKEINELCQLHKLRLSIHKEKEGNDCVVTLTAKVIDGDICSSASASSTTVKEAHRLASESLLMRLKEQGYNPKFDLDKYVKSCQKRTPILIGYDECPIDNSYSAGRDFKNDKPSTSYFQCLNPKSISSQAKAAKKKLTLSDSGVQSPKTAKSLLFDICSSNCWECPFFEPCHELQTNLHTLWTWKVIVQTESVVLECFGEPRASQDSAAESASEGALWYLRSKGFCDNLECT